MMRRTIGKEVGMSTKVIQVPMDSSLLERVSKCSVKSFRSRADFIRTACELLLDELERSQADSRYREGYKRKPENLDLPRASARLASQLLPKERW